METSSQLARVGFGFQLVWDLPRDRERERVLLTETIVCVISRYTNKHIMRKGDKQTEKTVVIGPYKYLICILCEFPEGIPAKT